MTKFKVGDILQIKKAGLSYSAFNEMFVRMGFADTKRNKIFSEGTIVQVFSVDYHPDTSFLLCGVRDMDGNESLCSWEGLQEIVFKKPEPKSIKVQVGDYMAEVFESHIEVGCQTISYCEFIRLIDAAKKIKFID
jgi:hypothetical protein